MRLPQLKMLFGFCTLAPCINFLFCILFSFDQDPSFVASAVTTSLPFTLCAMIMLVIKLDSAGSLVLSGLTFCHTMIYLNLCLAANDNISYETALKVLYVITLSLGPPLLFGFDFIKRQYQDS